MLIVNTGECKRGHASRYLRGRSVEVGELAALASLNCDRIWGNSELSEESMLQLAASKHWERNESCQ